MLTPEQHAALNEAYWHTKRTVADIRREFDLTESALAKELVPEPTGADCWFCSRTARSTPTVGIATTHCVHTAADALPVRRSAAEAVAITGRQGVATKRRDDRHAAVRQRARSLVGGAVTTVRSFDIRPLGERARLLGDRGTGDGRAALVRHLPGHRVGRRPVGRRRRAGVVGDAHDRAPVGVARDGQRGRLTDAVLHARPTRLAGDLRT